MNCKPAITLFCVLSAAAGFAIADDDHERARALAESGKILPLETLLAKLREHQPGKVLEVELENENGKPVYEIEILGPHGTVHEFKFDAVDGKLLNNKEEN